MDKYTVIYDMNRSGRSSFVNAGMMRVDAENAKDAAAQVRKKCELLEIGCRVVYVFKGEPLSF